MSYLFRNYYDSNPAEYWLGLERTPGTTSWMDAHGSNIDESILPWATTPTAAHNCMKLGDDPLKIYSADCSETLSVACMTYAACMETYLYKTQLTLYLCRIQCFECFCVVLDAENDDTTPRQHLIPRYRAKLTLSSPLTNPTVQYINTVSECFEVCRDYTTFDCVAFTFNDQYNYCYPRAATMQSSSATVAASNNDNHWQTYTPGNVSLTR